MKNCKILNKSESKYNYVPMRYLQDVSASFSVTMFLNCFVVELIFIAQSDNFRI